MEFIKENWFYLYGILQLVFTIRAFINNKKLKQLKISWINAIIYILGIAWIAIGIYTSERNLFIALAIITYAIPFLYGILNASSIDYEKLKNDYSKEAVMEEGMKSINSKEWKKFYALLFFAEMVTIICILVSHYKIALFYLLCL